MDLRQPQMGCIDHKGREIVVFENGALGYVDFGDDSDLRADSSYSRIINELSDLNSPPSYSPSRLDLPSMKRKYAQSLIIIYGLTIFLIIMPIALRRGTWNDMFSVWTGVDFNGWPRYFVAFVACMISLIPEIMANEILVKRKNTSVLTLDSKNGIIEIICYSTLDPVALTSQVKQVHSLVFSTIILSKMVFMGCIFINYGMTLTLAIISPFVIFFLFIYSYYINRKAPSENEIGIPEVELSEIYSYIYDHWGSTQLENIVSAGESLRLEFKASLWYDYDKADSDSYRYDVDYNPSDKVSKKERARSILKAVTGFLNSNEGGQLLIGVKDDGQIIGLESDFELLNASSLSKQKDLFEMRLDDLLKKNLKTNGDLLGLWDISWLEHKEHMVCMLKLQRSTHAIFLKIDEEEIYYIRTPSKTEPKSGTDLDKELSKFPRKSE